MIKYIETITKKPLSATRTLGEQFTWNDGVVYCYINSVINDQYINYCIQKYDSEKSSMMDRQPEIQPNDFYDIYMVNKEINYKNIIFIY